MNRQPEQQAPPVQKLRVRYAKRGRARFTSHRDFGRAFERALRRAQIPMAYSSGFNPHPRVSYANASPTGAATEAEYLEIGLAAVCDPAAVASALDAALPDGLDVLAVIDSPGGALADKLSASLWAVSLPNADRDLLAQAVSSFRAQESVEVQRMTKNGLRTFDARAAVGDITLVDDGLRLVICHTAPLVRPDDVVGALRQLEPTLDVDNPLVTRLAQGPLVGDVVTDPFA